MDIKNNIHLFGKKDDDGAGNDAKPTQDDSNPPNDGAKESNMLYGIQLLVDKDGSTSVQIEGTPTLVDIQMTLQRALNGVSTRITSETTCAMLLQVLGHGAPDIPNINPMDSN